MLPFRNDHEYLANISQTMVLGRSCLSATSKLLVSHSALDISIGPLDQILDPWSTCLIPYTVRKGIDDERYTHETMCSKLLFILPPLAG